MNLGEFEWLETVDEQEKKIVPTNVYYDRVFELGKIVAPRYLGINDVISASNSFYKNRKKR